MSAKQPVPAQTAPEPEKPVDDLEEMDKALLEYREYVSQWKSRLFPGDQKPAAEEKEKQKST